jgi:hypothetical protein
MDIDVRFTAGELLPDGFGDLNSPMKATEGGFGVSLEGSLWAD